MPEKGVRPSDRLLCLPVDVSAPLPRPVRRRVRFFPPCQGGFTPKRDENPIPEMGKAMPDTPAPENTETESPEVQPVTDTETDWKAEAEKWKALSRKNEETAKTNSAAAKKLAELEEANKSEIEKAQARAAAAEKELNDTRLEALRAQVALDKKLTPSQAKRLVGLTREELEADADELVADLKNSAPAPAPNPDGQGKQGEPVGGVKQITSREQLKSMSREQIAEARKTGALDSLLGAKGT